MMIWSQGKMGAWVCARKTDDLYKATAGLLQAITAAGGSPDQILQPWGLDPSVFSKSEGFILFHLRWNSKRSCPPPMTVSIAFRRESTPRI
jgi:hypothetical protein